MVPLSFSPDGSISSHTLSAGSVQPPKPISATSNALTTNLSAAPHAFLTSSKNTRSDALTYIKRCFDNLAFDVSHTQLSRQQENRLVNRKRKRSGDDESKALLLKKVHVEGFGTGQVWEQAKRVLEAAREEIERDLPVVLQNAGKEAPKSGTVHTSSEPDEDEVDDDEEEEDDDDDKPVKMVRFDGDGFELSESDDESLGEGGLDWEYDEDDVQGEEDDEAEEDFEGLSGKEEFHSPLDGSEEESGAEEEPPTLIEDKFKLNDGFFSIDDFNKQTEFLEQQDARGEDGEDSDDEGIDWLADPLKAGNGEQPKPKNLKRQQNGADDNDVEDDDEGGPGFGSMDLFAPEGASEDEFEDGDGDFDDEDPTSAATNTNNVMYKDFFAPPARKAGKKSREGAHPHNFPPKANGAGPEDGNDREMERAMNAVHRDLFSESPEPEEDSDIDPEAHVHTPLARRSTHEKRQAKLLEEIRRLESQNVAKREWQLSGEARAADRPMNSLLEEDMEFERAGKPVPVITAEVTEDIEALIKRRILNREFDEVIKRRPDDLVTTSDARRGKLDFELDDQKSGKGLAEIYEEEHLKRTDPNFVDVRDEKLKKEHREIEALWADCSAKLDALSSWHHRPKPPQAQLEIRVDAPVVSMEDARPTAGADVAGMSMLAPQEVYKLGEEREKGEVVTKGGTVVKTDELTRDQKARRRRREKERLAKAGLQKKPDTKKDEKARVVGDLKRGGVKVIGKKGLTDVEGKAVKNGVPGRVSGGSFKL
ncbi:Mpp10 protein [Aulographum hederae CBS 113979]|uniref:U3 small nucleolar ribonucleoprotein protein MPP10 n=1 Tax=Aulographum hederae CBS 113979 TaxID=1176131 RepID=A0A6G1H4T7_9PEZI|nr:Mpp10 protein [Aulographum hederae CBS 113979]